MQEKMSGVVVDVDKRYGLYPCDMMAVKYLGLRTGGDVARLYFTVKSNAVL